MKMSSNCFLWQGNSEEKEELEEDTKKWEEGIKMNEDKKVGMSHPVDDLFKRVNFGKIWVKSLVS